MYTLGDLVTAEQIARKINSSEPDLVAGVVAEAIAAERERCAQIAEHQRAIVRNGRSSGICKQIASAIRGSELG